MKYLSPFLVIGLKGPHTSECMIPNKSLALSNVPLKGVLVILPCKQDSHTLNELSSFVFKRPFF
ncbi:hypothetical protein HanRHA438_Chr11g0499731 [Helianthus annuus]|nr:hypothetical protein HanRHA438_Chr11g0499731 [Helianthus annuus]